MINICFFLMCTLKVLSWNVRGIMSSTLCLSNLMIRSNCDVCIVSEHKLKDASLDYLNTIERGYKSVAKAEILPPDYKAYHGKGGIAILYKKSLQFSVNVIEETGSNRIVGIELKNSHMGRYTFLVHTYHRMTRLKIISQN